MDRRRFTTLILYVMAILVLASLPVHAIEEKQFPAAYWKQKGDTCFQAGRFAEALEFYTKALDGAKRNADDHIYYASIGSIGNIYGSMGDLKRALYYFKMGYAASVERKDTKMQWTFSTCMVSAYSMLKDTKSAKAFFRQQMAIPIKDMNVKRFHFLQNQAYISLSEDNPRMAEYYFRQTRDFALERRMQSQYYIAPEIEIGKLKTQRGDLKGAMECFRTAYDSLQHTGANPDYLVNVYKEMSGIFDRTGQKDSAEKYRSKYLAMSDSVFNAQQFNIANSKLFEYENTQTKETIDDLVSRNNILITAVIIFVIMMCILSFIYIALRRKTRSLLEAQRMLVDKNEELMQNDRQNKLLLEQYVSMASKQTTPHEPAAAPPREERYAAKEEQQEDTADGEKKRADISLSEEQRNRLLNSIVNVLNDIKVISQSDFNLTTLSTMVGSNTKYVSWVINDAYNKNFKTLLNEHRIREACRRMSDTEHYGNMTLRTIYEELGYNSATNFIQSFKKVNGMTPSMYQKLLRKNEVKED